jgi:flagellar protein FlbD
MIRLTRLNHLPFVLNQDRIEHVESTPDTVVVMDNGQRFMVLETADELVEKVIEFRRRLGVPSIIQADQGGSQ